MRACIYLISILAAGCMSTEASASTDEPSTSADEPSTSSAGQAQRSTLSCDSSIAEYCTDQGGCDLTLEAAQHDERLCSPGIPAGAMACGGYDVVVKGEIDTVRRYYYRHGQLEAIVQGQVVNPALTGCLAGPATFRAPMCPDRQTTTLPVCTGG